MDPALLVFKRKSWERETEAERGKRRDGERTGGRGNINDKCVGLGGSHPQGQKVAVRNQGEVRG